MPLLVTNIILTETPKTEIADRLKCEADDIVSVELLKKSVDGRRRPPVWLANFLVVLSREEQSFVDKKIHGVRLFTERDEQKRMWGSFDWDKQHELTEELQPIVVGAGPAGLFAALRFAELGAAPRLIERGGDVKDRHYAVRDFWRHGIFHPQNNVVFGEGGAGAFSDGKIYTRRRDGELGWVFQRLVDFGADPEILLEGWAHLGTDKIREILPKMRARIIELGGTVHFHTCVDDLIVEDGFCVGVETKKGVFRGNPVVMATGHSARDSWKMMMNAGAEAIARPIRIGVRVEHPQKLIDAERYGKERDGLPPASYRLVSNPKEKGVRGAHTFCMCPGGTVVGATSHEGHVVVNGMSYSGRRAFWANSAIIVDVRLEDYDGKDAWAGIRFQDRIEQAAFQAGGGDFRAPAQLVTDFLQRKKSKELPRSSFPNGVFSHNLWDIFPEPIANGIAEALRFFDKRIKGFAGPQGLLIAPETRTSAPLRFTRTESLYSTTLDGLMPIGEGAGYAGGIASAALDGLRAAQSACARHQR
jgi:uncharacterized FAD-dependent dehydrogenase